MQDSIGEYRIEFGLEGQRQDITQPNVEASQSCRIEQRLALVDAHKCGSVRSQFLGQRPITAAKIENALAWFRVKPVNNFIGKIGNEAAILCIRGRVPSLNV